jgi:hypothetical protein
VGAEGNQLHVMRGLHTLTLSTPRADRFVGRGPAFLLEGLPDRISPREVAAAFGPDLQQLVVVRLGFGRIIASKEEAPIL